jgi:hypothetical protein
MPSPTIPTRVLTTFDLLKSRPYTDNEVQELVNEGVLLFVLSLLSNFVRVRH